MTTKCVGICMDHSKAHIMPLAEEFVDSNLINVKFVQAQKALSTEHSEKTFHHKEQDGLSSFFKELAEIIKNYGNVVLFGPTEAKLELLNRLKADHHFDKIKIDTRDTDKMTENQERAFVKQYFRTIHAEN
jgi:hypothetical protein